METYIALLRGINVSGKNLIRMELLVKAMTETGLLNVRTYIQSGNIVFESPEKDEERFAVLITEKIKERFGFIISVLVLQQKALIKIRDSNPLILDHGLPLERLYLTLLEKTPDTTLLDKILTIDYSPDRFLIRENAVYLHCPVGYGNSRLNNNFFENKLKVRATTRNWATVIKLCLM